MKSLLILILFTASYGFAQNNSISENRSIQPFENIEASSFASIVVTKSENTTCNVEVSPAKYLDSLITKVEGNTLRIETQGDLSNIKDFKIFVSTPSLHRLQANEFAKIKLLDTFLSEDCIIELNEFASFKGALQCKNSLNINANSQSSLDISLNSTNLNIIADGFAKVKLEGKAKEVYIETERFGRVKAKGLQFENAKVKAEDISKVKIDKEKVEYVNKKGFSKIK